MKYHPSLPLFPSVPVFFTALQIALLYSTLGGVPAGQDGRSPTKKSRRDTGALGAERTLNSSQFLPSGKYQNKAGVLSSLTLILQYDSSTRGQGFSGFFPAKVAPSLINFCKMNFENSPCKKFTLLILFL